MQGSRACALSLIAFLFGAGVFFCDVAAAAEEQPSATQMMDEESSPPLNKHTAFMDRTPF